MKNAVFLIFIFLMSCTKTAEETGLDFFKQMEGRWTADVDYVEEEWTVNDDGSCYGEVRTKGGAEDFVNERITVQIENEQLIYIGELFDRTQKMEIRFALEQGDKDYVRFKNTAHEFPQNIEYWKVSDTHVRARISGEMQGKKRERDFNLYR